MRTTIYFATTADTVSEHTVARYINAQSTRFKMPEGKVYRFKIEPNKKQESAFNRFAGARRKVFNWALGRQIGTFKSTGKSIPWSTLSAELTALKTKTGWEWLSEIDSQLLQQALADCKKAFVNFFKKRAGFPQFKRKHSARQSFRIPSVSRLTVDACTFQKSDGLRSDSLSQS